MSPEWLDFLWKAAALVFGAGAVNTSKPRRRSSFPQLGVRRTETEGVNE